MRNSDAVLESRDRDAVKVDSVLWLIPLVLSGIGILMVTSTTSPMSFEISGTPFTMGIRQLKWLGIGIVIMVLTYCVPMRVWLRASGLFWLFSAALMAATLIPGVGVRVGGAQRWIRLFGISIQPSEILIIAVVMLAAKVTVKNEMNPGKCFLHLLALMFFSILPLLAQPDFGSTVLIMIVCMGMYVERFGWKLPLITGAVSLFFITPMILFVPYRMRRIYAFLNPWIDPFGEGFQTIQGLIAFANGGVWGSGLGHGFQKLQYLPAAYTDFIYAAMGEELGLIGTLGVLVLCMMWVIRCRVLYNRVPEGYDTSLVWGITLTIVAPFFINIAGVTHLMPLSGMPLPFISYGGSALVMMWMRVGLLLRAYKEYVEVG
jgi:cell division protein FtsW